VDFVSALLEAFAPTRCAGCDMPGSLLCDRCARDVRVIDPAFACPVCGAPYGWLTCTECWNTEPAYVAARSHALLEPPLSRCLVLFKDAAERRLASALGGMLALSAAEWLGWAEAVVPVPASQDAVRRRGYDHTALLAAQVSAFSGVPTRHLLRPGAARDQRSLGRDQRRANMAEAFAVLPGVDPPRYVLLVDDVMTTGATADSCATALLGAGAHEVRVCALARAW
jgi:ComF family protein